MGRCSTCRSQTQNFCFVHQEFVCDTCLVNRTLPTTHLTCVVKTYRHWLQDSEYEWPPQCAACNLPLEELTDTVRRKCLHVEHAKCLENSTPPDHACPSCNTPLEKSLTSESILTKALQSRIQKMSILRQLLPQQTEAEGEKLSSKTHTTNTTSTNKGTILQPQSLPTLPAKTTVRTTRPVSTRSTTSLTATGTVTTPLGRAPKRPLRPLPTPGRDDNQSSTSVNNREEAVNNTERETRINVGTLHLSSNVDNGHGYGAKKEKNVVTNESMRRAIKAGNRRWVDWKRKIKDNKKQVIIVSLFVVCLLLIWLLTRGDEDDMKKRDFTTNSMDPPPDVEVISLPHVRVNPAFLEQKEEVQ